ncbi:kinesin-like protein KIN-14S [Tanacetum coccineum]
MKPLTRARRGSYVVKPAPTVTSQVLKQKRRASIASFQSDSSSSAMTTPINQSSAAPRMRNDRVMGRQSFVWDPQRMWRTSRVKSPLGQSNEAASSSHAVEAVPVAAPRSNKFMGSLPSHVVGSWKPKHPTVVALQRKQLVWSPLKNKGIKPVRKSFVPSNMSPENMCHGGTNLLTEKYVGPTLSLGKESLTSVPQRPFPSDMSLGKVENGGECGYEGAMVVKMKLEAGGRMGEREGRIDRER